MENSPNAQSRSTEFSPAKLIDLARYPIFDLTSDAAQTLTRHCRAQLDETGACELPGFLTPDAVELLTREGDALSSLAYHSVSKGTPYLEIPDSSLPEDHPRRIIDHTSVGVIAYDQFPPDSAMRRLYEWQPLMDFIGAALGKERLYRYADPFGALNLAVMSDGERLHWHYDQTDFVTSIALRAADDGGDFEYVPLIRSATDENYDAVRSLLKGSEQNVVRVPMHPGTLLLFEGRNSIHRVTAIRGSTTRLVALLAYDTKPGTRSSKLLQRARYGREA
ncbi:MAG TPA: hypothetical protein VN867_14445 [Candidatus Binataceae bacterium]|nr:hypothetical protein [Candidatus Binataceae bacterium]